MPSVDWNRFAQQYNNFSLQTDVNDSTGAYENVWNGQGRRLPHYEGPFSKALSWGMDDVDQWNPWKTVNVGIGRGRDPYTSDASATPRQRMDALYEHPYSIRNAGKFYDVYGGANSDSYNQGEGYGFEHPFSLSTLRQQEQAMLTRPRRRRTSIPPSRGAANPIEFLARLFIDRNPEYSTE